MREFFTTKEQARNYRYNQWAGNANGTKYDEARCAYPVWSGGRGSMQHQCANKNGHGPDGLYCHIHVSMIPTKDAKTWYVVSAYRFTIEPVEITKATEKLVWTNGRKTRRESKWERYFETLEAAKTWVISVNERAIANHLAEIERAKTIIAQTKQ